MITAVSLHAMQARFGGSLSAADASVDRVCIDSRTLKPGDCFVAIVGENFDGHTFVEAAVAAGAQSLVVSQAWAKQHAPLPVPTWQVANTTEALWQFARIQREHFQGPVVAITGSAGKTTVKQMLAAIGQAAFGADAVLFTQGNLNNHIGVSLTLFSLTPAHRFAVIEMGASGPGEIAPLAWQAQPSVSVVNNVMPVHVEGFGSVAGVADTKSAIYDGLSAEGVAVINADDGFAPAFKQKNLNRQQMTFSLADSAADVYASDVENAELHARFMLHSPHGSQLIQLPVAGIHNVGNALCAAACALASGISLDIIARGLAGFESAKGRYHVIKVSDRLTVIDDTYNANPEAVKAALRAQASFTTPRWLVLGDMGELGPQATEMHADVGTFARDLGVEKVFTVGTLSQATSAAAGGLHFETQAALIAALQDDIRRQAGPTTILIKGSRSARMEFVVQALNNNGGVH
ncbi:UDP-N-acetylmuramoyl-tripeptide--D-alanyl-D-alanine ligase [Simiduia agarivorans]|uniref:UDP-N-acetylmuramoyl-tripeptide--D-alanyl-D-alanine ligase n=1 Tax=Simiduia agarivorans (strain DSM 21679 / JCM 13881 / BCRC 17597 / SA1) TaxID=1117647 RepID=K4KNV8_SIMAS|nr:UDP-N-acetylmuramoyl-tripeptide--D-alanyl-D-alanine ligase [Simiduia agarivorans]AFV00687.1 UDP-N-acetylmuramoyl-tripeptide-D-alanyl-D- alanine ligase [Simiduia agarivorans SA1 = DSM 21679]